MIRLKDVAARAGVSLMTVSKVLRDAPDVSAGTKARIRQLAQDMGYVPDALARGLRTRRTKLFGLVLPSITHPFFGPTAMTIEHRAYELGYDLLLAQTHDEPHREEVCVRRLLSRHVDGLFLAPVYRLSPTAPVYDEVQQSATPTVLLGHPAGFCAGFAGVETDDAQAAYHVTQHFLGLGHRQVAFFAGLPAAPSAQEQFEGYRRALREARIPIDDRLVFTAGSTFEDGRRAASQLLNESSQATAVQTCSDAVATGTMALFWERGLRVPDDISVSGFGNHAASEQLRVPLTTVHQPAAAIGTVAVETMLRLMRGEKPEAKRLPVDVIQRASTGSPPSARRQTNSNIAPADDEMP